MTDPDAGLLGEDLCRTAAPRDCAIRDLNDGATTSKNSLGLTYDFDYGRARQLHHLQARGRCRQLNARSRPRDAVGPQEGLQLQHGPQPSPVLRRVRPSTGQVR
jgi:hypothetical protein